MKRSLQIDLLKGLAILDVIFQHSLSRPSFAGIGGPMYILQAVAVFMILAGYNSARSYARRNVQSIADGYRWSVLSRPLLRLVVPFLAIWLLEAALMAVRSQPTVGDYLYAFVTGGPAWGGYFVPVIVGHTLLFPLVYALALRLPGLLLPVTFVVDMGFELLSFRLGLPEAIYEGMYLRYLFAVALGVWLATGKAKARWVIPMALLGGAYVFALEYGGLVLPLNPLWASRTAPSFAYALIFVVAGLALLPAEPAREGWRTIAMLGRASYHIFLLQGVYFWLLYSPPPRVPEYEGSFAALALLPVVGWLFYRADSAIRDT